MPTFKPVIIPAGSWQAQADFATAQGCVAEVVIHRNSGGGRYTLVEIGSNASRKSYAMAADLAQRFRAATGLPFPSDYPDGVKKLGYQARGDACVRYFDEPVCLGEINFNDEPAQDEWSEKNHAIEARCYFEMLAAQYPQGGTIGIAIGHVVNGPNDSGAEDYDHDMNERAMNHLVASELVALMQAAAPAQAPDSPESIFYAVCFHVGYEDALRMRDYAEARAGLEQRKYPVAIALNRVPRRSWPHMQEAADAAGAVLKQYPEG